MEPFFICFEHTTYWFEFTDQFGPAFYRIEKEEYIQIDFRFDEDGDYNCTSNAFLWDFFDEWHKKYKESKNE